MQFPTAASALFVLVLGATGPVLANNGSQAVSERQARALFAEFVARSRASDPREADLYCEDGTVVMYRKDEHGAASTVRGPLAAFGRFVRESADESRLAGDYSDFSDATFIAEGGRIRINATRLSALHGQRSPASFLIAHCPDGEPGIMELRFHWQRVVK